MRAAVGLLHHNSCVGVPNFGEPFPGTARAGYCGTFDHGWEMAGLAFLLTVLGVALARRRLFWGSVVCVAVVLAAVAIAIVGSQLNAFPPSPSL